MAKITLTDAVKTFIADKHMVSCGDVAIGCKPALGYEPGLAAVSRVLGELGWTKHRVRYAWGSVTKFSRP
jgi:hypothetical protein